MIKFSSPILLLRLLQSNTIRLYVTVREKYAQKLIVFGTSGSYSVGMADTNSPHLLSKLMDFAVCPKYFVQRGVAIYFQDVPKLRKVQTSALK